MKLIVLCVFVIETGECSLSPSQHGSEYLYQAFLHFFEHFRVVYVGDVIQKTSKVLV